MNKNVYAEKIERLVRVEELPEKVHLKNLLCKVKKGGKIIDFSQNLHIQPSPNVIEKLWNLANKYASEGKGRVQGWKILSKIVGQSYNSIRQKNERLRAKPLKVYAKLLQFLRKRGHKNYDLNWLEDKIVRITWKKSSYEKCLKFPTTLLELGLAKPREIEMKIKKIKWVKLHMKPKAELHLKDLLIKVSFTNPYYKIRKTRIGREYTVNFAHEVRILPKEEVREKLWRLALENVPGRNKKIRRKNLAGMVGTTPSAISERQNRGKVKPLIVYSKLLKLLKEKGYAFDLDWLEDNLEGVSRGSGYLVNVDFPVKWKTKEGMIFLSSLIGDGGLAFRSDFGGWAEPFYSQWDNGHPELKKMLFEACRKLFGSNFDHIDLSDREINFPVIIGYLTVVSGYFQPGHKNLTRPELPLTRNDPEELIITSFNWLISDDGTVTEDGDISLSGGTGTSEVQPYLLQIADYMNEIVPELTYSIDWYNGEKRTCHQINFLGNRLVKRTLYQLLRKINNGFFAKEKNKNIRTYLTSGIYKGEEYKKRYSNIKTIEEMKKKVVKVLKQKSLTIREMSMKLNISERKLRRHLVNLKKRGVVDFVSKGSKILERDPKGKIVRSTGSIVKWFLCD